MQDFNQKMAVITGGGTGMGRELALQLSQEGCHVAICDVSEPNMLETLALCKAAAPSDTRVTQHLCDVSDEAQVMAFRDAVLEAHQTDHINLLFSNAGIGGGGSFLLDDREEWERTFGVCWYGVYYSARAFLPLLVASDQGYIVNTSSVNGFWAALGPGIAHTAYSAAKFAVKGFSEALITELKVNAPHVSVAVVMPGHIGTSIALNTSQVQGKPGALEMASEDVAEIRQRMLKQGLPVSNLTDDHIRQAMHQRALDFRDKAPTSAADAASVILQGVREGRWRILIGEDAQALDELVRSDPDAAYEDAFFEGLQQRGIFSALSEAPPAD